MIARPRALGTTLVAAAIVLAGCGTTGAPTAALGAKATAKQPAKAAAATTVETEMAIVQDGRVEIRVSGLATAARKLMATTAQVSAIKITLSGGGLTAPRSQNVSAATLAGGKGTVAFDGVPNGTVAVAIEATDAAGAKIGEKATNATVAKGQTAVVAVALKLFDTHVTSENGNLAFDLEVQDGTVVVDPIDPASPRPSSPVLSPTPSAPPAGFVVDDEQRTWYGDGKIKYSGRVKNTGGTAKAAKVTITFSRMGFYKRTTIETQEVNLGVLNPGATAKFSVTSVEKIKGLFDKGDAQATVTTP